MPGPRKKTPARPRLVPADAALPPAGGVSIPLPVPIIVIHGGPASNLFDLYPVQPDAVYTLTRGGWPLHKPGSEKNFDRLPVDPDEPAVTLNTGGRAVAPARVTP